MLSIIRRNRRWYVSRDGVELFSASAESAWQTDCAWGFFKALAEVKR